MSCGQYVRWNVYKSFHQRSGGNFFYLFLRSCFGTCPSMVTKDPMFTEMSNTIVKPNFHDPNANVHDEENSALVGLKVSGTSIHGNDSLHPGVTIQELDQRSHNIKFWEIRSTTSQVTLLITFEAPEVVKSNEHLEWDVTTRYVNVNSLSSGSLRWKPDLARWLFHRTCVLE